MMSTRANPADAGSYPRQFLNWPSLTEFLKTTKLWYLEIGILYLTLVIEKNLYFAVSF